MQELILNTYNRIYSEKSFPEMWSMAIIVAIPKPNKDITDPQSYRQISKLMEFITKFQTRFRSERSTMDNLVATIRK